MATSDPHGLRDYVGEPANGVVRSESVRTRLFVLDGAPVGRLAPGASGFAQRRRSSYMQTRW